MVIQIWYLNPIREVSLKFDPNTVKKMNSKGAVHYTRRFSGTFSKVASGIGTLCKMK